MQLYYKYYYIIMYAVCFCQKLVKSTVLLFQHKLPIASKLNTYYKIYLEI